MTPSHRSSSTQSQSTGLLSPPASTRTSLESPPNPPAPISASTARAPLVIGSIVSPPDSLASSPIGKDSPLSKFQAFVKSGNSQEEEIECVVEGVDSLLVCKLLEDFKSYMAQTEQADLWDRLNIDFISDKLIIRFPTAGHELVSDLVCMVQNEDHRSGTGGPLFFGGGIDIPFHCGGFKTPDYGIYERKGIKDTDTSKDTSLDHSVPTIAFEVGFSQSRDKLMKKAAQLICLTAGHILLVIAIDIVHVPNSCPRRLKSVIWSHWEEDHIHHVEDPEHTVGEEDNVITRVTDSSTLAFSATVSVHGMTQRVHIRATEKKKWRLYPGDPEIPEIKILHRHLFRDLNEAAAEMTVFSFNTSEVMAEILYREGVQGGEIDQKT
ncbi:hypothetical protein EDB83DRAFT_2534734 [Lactarius deliciosus]|nr:hypothetical protein EDB83DRAFT_2534734 [Lactarius deliciosus]